MLRQLPRVAVFPSAEVARTAVGSVSAHRPIFDDVGIQAVLFPVKCFKALRLVCSLLHVMHVKYVAPWATAKPT